MGEKPDISNLRLYGSKIFIRIPEIKREDKWDKKSELGILVGYEKVGYRVLSNNRVAIARHVDIVEENVNIVGFKGDTNDYVMNENNQNRYDPDGNNGSGTNERGLSDENVNNEIELRRSQRNRQQPDRYSDSNYAYCIYVNYVSADSPQDYTEAINDEYYKDWQKAMNKELECLNKNKTWTLVERPQDKRILDLKWVYTKKSENVFKARLVVRGFQQKEIIEDIYSPVARMQTLKLLLSYCTQNGLIIMQMDVETAFLNGKVVSEVYVKQPQGYEE